MLNLLSYTGASIVELSVLVQALCGLLVAEVTLQGCVPGCAQVGVVFRVLGAYTGQPLLGAKAVAGMLMFCTVTGAPRAGALARL